MIRGVAGATVAARRVAADAPQIWTALAVSYLVSVTGLEATRLAYGFPSPRGFAASPAAIAAGKVWLLATSALLVSGAPALGLGPTPVSLLELAAFVAAVALLLSWLGGAAFWRAAIVGHVVATLLVYAGVGLIWLASHDLVSGVLHDPDYGVSSIWLAVLGALSISASERMRAGERRGLELALISACSVAGLAGATLFSGFVDAEHGFAFAFGALVTAQGVRADRCGAPTRAAT
jgi:hypothetical protein